MKKKTAIWIKIIVLGILTLALIGILIVGIPQLSGIWLFFQL